MFYSFFLPLFYTVTGCECTNTPTTSPGYSTRAAVFTTVSAGSQQLTSISPTASTSTNIPWPVTITRLHHSHIKEYSSSSIFSTPQEHLTASPPATPAASTTDITYSNENDHEVFRHTTGTDASLILAIAVSIPILAIVMAVISAVVVTALLCMKAKRLKAGGTERVVSDEDSVYFGENTSIQHST